MIAGDGRYEQKLTDNDLIKLFAQGRYVADLEEGIIYNRRGSPVATFTGNEEGHLWLRLYRYPGRRSVAVHRVIWVIGNQTAIPDKWEIHHRNLDPTDNRFSNLFCLHPNDHRKLHGRAKLVEDGVPF